MSVLKILDKDNHQVDMILCFAHDYRFLSNFWPCDVTLPAENDIPEIAYNSVENAYMAWKTTDLQERQMMQGLSAKEAKKLSENKQITIREDYSDIGRIDIMTRLVSQKFSDKNPELKQQLINTGEMVLVEGNLWDDQFFGVCLKTGAGNNHLGKILMAVRKNLLKRN